MDEHNLLQMLQDNWQAQEAAKAANEAFMQNLGWGVVWALLIAALLFACVGVILAWLQPGVNKQHEERRAEQAAEFYDLTKRVARLESKPPARGVK